ncbi:hybrid sensor histidine kinase/response regulator transcription factor [Dawidia soli]|uniref:histidine kinase n=1 Tax=Dawidia soli TaxID=2782352 RepID=A0AAP2D903_9BACT|nr:two-component regulator propeller domain-containing protein [Dawidia soli]MBT1687633.1 response regulator [Dawidia soli]
MARSKYYLIILIAGLQSGLLGAQPGLVNFKHFSYREGLVQSPVSAFLQDDQGFIWSGNLKGLTRYDGYEFKTFVHSASDTTSISNDRVNAVFMDSEKTIWVATAHGLNRFDRDLETFESIDLVRAKGGRNYISAIAEDGRKNLWIGTFGGLKKLNKTTKTLEDASITETISIANEAVYSLYIDNEGKLWVGSKSGLSRFDPVSRKILPLPDAIQASTLHRSTKVVAIRQTVDGDLWFGTETSGVFRFNAVRNEIRSYAFKENCANCLSSNWIKDILVYDSNTLWFATQNGISQLNASSNQFTNYLHESTNTNTISDNAVRCLMKDRASCVWVGTFSGGIDFFYPGNSNFNNIGEAIGPKGLLHPLVNALVEDSDGSLWVGTYGGGVTHINRKLDSFTHYSVKSPRHGRMNNGIKSLANDGENLWIGTLEGLSVLQKTSGKITHFDIPTRQGRLGEKIVHTILPDDGGAWIGTNGGGLKFFRNGQTLLSHINEGKPGSIADNYVTALLKDSLKNIWVGTQDGLSYYDTQKKAFTQLYRRSRDIQSRISHNHITVFFVDSKHRMWIGTERGLNYFDLKSKEFYPITDILGLADNFIHAITEDKDQNLWFSTDMGLVKLSFRKFGIPFNADDFHITVYKSSDGLPCNQFSNTCGLSLQTHELAFGGTNGMSVFSPDKLMANTSPATIVLTEILINNKRVPIGGESPIAKSPTRVDKITLRYDQGSVSFKFAALNYINAEKSQYAIRVEGLRGDEAWQPLGNQRIVNFTNLQPGSYKLYIKASNDGKHWGNGIRELALIVLPPWWRTWWAYAIYFLLATGAVTAVLAFMGYRRRMLADLQMEHILNERRQELYQMKMNFFTNISHEIRTPLTLILGPVQKLMDSLSGERLASKQLLLIRNNASRLLKLVTELMDFRKAEEGHLSLYISQQDIVPFCKKIFEYFQGLADDKSIAYEFLSDEESIWLYFDSNQLEKVVFNLLSNAFKFTPDHRKIVLSIQSRDEWVDIHVSDNGKGIPEAHQDQLFRNFYQVDDSGRQNMGSGVGLALSKTIVELHKGTLHFKSDTRTGEKAGSTTFTVSLKKGVNHFDKTQIVSESFYSDDRQEIGSFADPVPGDALETPRTTQVRPTILIAEDNDEVRSFIADTLRPDYEIIEFANGSHALVSMARDIPDLIISDIMMPGTDGLALCASVKSTENTNHIPVILLTARSSIGNQVQGLATGADAYISKPFNTKILELTIKNLLTAKEIMREKFSQQLILQPTRISLTSNSPEEKFIGKLVSIIESKMDDPQFDVDALVIEIGMSRSVLYKKVQALTNYSIADLIKEMRLKKAAELLKQPSMSVADAAFSVGFNDRKYFSKEFRKQFEMSPSEFIDAHQTKD